MMASLPAAGLADYCAGKAAVSQLHACLRWALRALLPPLEAPYVATRIVCAVQTRQHELVLPWHLKWLSPLLELLPLRVRDAVLDLGGAQSAMTSFRGRGRGDWQGMAGGGT